MTRTVKPITYSVVIYGLVFAWHLVWTINFAPLHSFSDVRPGFSSGILQIAGNARQSLDDNTSWFSYHALFYFVLIPLSIFAVTLVFAWNERAFCRKHPFRFLAVALAALSPGIFAAVLLFLTCSFL